MTATVHASALVVDGCGVLIRGASGAGKSSLLLGLLDRQPATAELVADDRVELVRQGDELVMQAPPALAGLMEVRGQGIFRRPFRARVPLGLVVDLLPQPDCVRLPEPDEREVVLEGVAVPRIYVVEGAPDGPARVAFALQGPAPVERS